MPCPRLQPAAQRKKKPRGVVRNAPGRGKPFRVELAFALGNENTFVRSPLLQNLFGWCPLLRWGSNKHLFVPRFRVAADKIQMFVPRFRVGERKYICSLPAFALGKQQTNVRSPTLRLGDENTNVRSSLLCWGTKIQMFAPRFCVWATKIHLFGRRFCGGERKYICSLPAFAPGKLHPDGFSQKTRGVLPVLACFLSKRAAFCLPRRVFCQNAPRFPRLGVFSAKTRGVFLVSAHFLPKRGTFSPPRSIFRENGGWGYRNRQPPMFAAPWLPRGGGRFSYSTELRRCCRHQVRRRQRLCS